MRLLATVVLVTAGLAAGCGDDSGTATESVATEKCTIYATGTEASVTFEGPVGLCADAASEYSQGGTLWTNDATVAAGREGASDVCTVTLGGATATVRDTPGGIFGEHRCADFVAAGWTEIVT